MEECRRQTQKAGQGNGMSASGSNESVRADQLYRELNRRQDELVAQGVPDYLALARDQGTQSCDRC